MAHSRANHHLRHPHRKPHSTRLLNDPEKAYTEEAKTARVGPTFQSETVLPTEK